MNALTNDLVTCASPSSRINMGEGFKYSPSWNMDFRWPGDFVRAWMPLFREYLELSSVPSIVNVTLGKSCDVMHTRCLLLSVRWCTAYIYPPWRLHNLNGKVCDGNCFSFLLQREGITPQSFYPAMCMLFPCWEGTQVVVVGLRLAMWARKYIQSHFNVLCKGSQKINMNSKPQNCISGIPMPWEITRWPIQACWGAFSGEIPEASLRNQLPQLYGGSTAHSPTYPTRYPISHSTLGAEEGTQGYYRSLERCWGLLIIEECPCWTLWRPPRWGWCGRFACWVGSCQEVGSSC